MEGTRGKKRKVSKQPQAQNKDLVNTVTDCITAAIPNITQAVLAALGQANVPVTPATPVACADPPLGNHNTEPEVVPTISHPNIPTAKPVPDPSSEPGPVSTGLGISCLADLTQGNPPPPRVLYQQIAT